MKPSELSRAASAEIVDHITGLGATGLPLVAGLRAAAQESDRRPVSRALLAIAAEIERGADLAAAVAAPAAGFPRFFRGLVAAASQTGQLAVALDECLALHRQIQRVWRTMVGSLIYPLFVLLLVAGVLALLFAYVVPDFKVLFSDFQLQLPAVTVAMIQISDSIVLFTAGAMSWFLVGLVGGVALLLLLVRGVVGAANWQWLLGTVPLFGPMLSWSSAASFAKTLGVLIEHQLPLPDALALTADGISDANVRAACLQFSAGAAAGARLSELVSSSHRLPQSLIPFIQAGEDHGELPEALRTAGDMFFERLRLRAQLLQSVSPPILFTLVALTIMLAIIGLMMPLFDLVSGLA